MPWATLDGPTGRGWVVLLVASWSACSSASDTSSGATATGGSGGAMASSSAGVGAASGSAGGGAAGVGVAGSGAAGVAGSVAGLGGGAGAGAGGAGGSVAGGPPDAGAAAGSDAGGTDAGVAADAGPGTTVETLAIDCATPESIVVNDPAVRVTVRVADGDYQDRCDGEGNLVQYSCEVVPDPACMPVLPNPPPCPLVATGEVVEETVDCDGQCAGGVCAGRCPWFEDPIEVLANDGTTVRLANGLDTRTFECELTFDHRDDGVDCTAVAVGTTGSIDALGLSTMFCTGDVWGNIGVCYADDCSAIVENCGYACHFSYDE